MEILPEATVTHCIKGRVRLKIFAIPSPRERYFNRVSETLSQAFKDGSIRINSVTGSLLLECPDLDLDSVVRHGQKNGLFRLNIHGSQAPVTVARVARTQIKRIDDGIRKLSCGILDMPGSVFVLLIAHAMREIMRGKLALPNWFSALWIASTIYNREFYGHVSDGVHVHDDGDSHTA
ncbi:conserved hypothetical protein [Desulforapulum autotrophicum HRM2]|uniref:Uncharacterized protein n=1 Tax=Desulforapulum autotrophicum (strain ATCC 43914 / DSM 3382 / VKM B-1955 / HRM2) TaxID=177437 RepID=C0QCV8_DESAH|nr:hypothetical protein [Desulforapulum autotrophicum]ACN17190.1 conserved hypothetical protein [Desulforapulum autotrophicum HRM2]